MLRSFQIPLIALFVFLSYSCSKPDQVKTIGNFTLNASLSGTQQVPSNTSTVSGKAFSIHNPNTRLFTITLFDLSPGFTATSGYVHKGAVGVNGPSIIRLTSTTNGEALFTNLDAAQAADLMANLYYININSAAYPAGEIRGQLIKQ